MISSFEKNIIINELMIIPGIGKSLANDLYLLGIRTIEDLKNKNPMHMYHRLCFLTGQKQDKCVLYVFRCAVYYATETDNLDTEKLKWWYWKDNTYNEND